MGASSRGKYPNQSGHAVRTARTRERILQTSLDLFNERGEVNVTTGHIAEGLNMSPGNLYYHFRNKDEIILALFERFERDIDVAPPEGTVVAADMTHLWMYVHVMFDAIWEYRFLYRNLNDIVERNAKLRESFNSLSARKLAAVRSLCEGLRASGAMEANDEAIAALALNALIVATYWLNFAASQVAAKSGENEATLARGVYQVMALVSPFLTPQANAQLQALAGQYRPQHEKH